MRGAISWLKDKGWRAERMIYFGRSVGAGVALQLALEQPPGGNVFAVVRPGWHSTATTSCRRKTAVGFGAVI
jgi:dienelactone hydrolase